MDFVVVYKLDEDVTDGYTDWISPLKDHARVSFTIGDLIWGDIAYFKTGLTIQGGKDANKVKARRHYPTLNISRRDLHSTGGTDP